MILQWKQRHGRPGMNDLAVELALFSAMAIEIDDQLAGRQHAFDVIDVEERSVRSEILGVRQRKRLHVPVVQIDAAFFSSRLHELIEKAIAPRPRQLPDHRFHAPNIDLGQLARSRAHDEEAAGQ
jgi:hypothetical protein